MTDIQNIYSQTTSFIKLLEKLPNEFSDKNFSFLILNHFENLNDCYIGIIIKNKTNYIELEKLTISFSNMLLSFSDKIDNNYFEKLFSTFVKLSKLYIHLTLNKKMENGKFLN
jgi:hypothetical protein